MSESGHIVVAGNVNIDLIMYGVPVLPAWGQEVAGTARVEAVAGQAGYLALAATRLGRQARVISAVGADAAGQRVRNELAQSGVDTQAIEIIEGQATQLTVAAVRPDGERAFLSDFGASHHLTTDLLARHWDLINGAAAVALVGVYNLPHLDLAGAAELLGRAREAGAVTVVDTGWDPGGFGPDAVTGLRSLLAGTDLFLPNLDEATAVTQETGVPAVHRQPGLDRDRGGRGAGLAPPEPPHRRRPGLRRRPEPARARRLGRADRRPRLTRRPTDPPPD
jgi:ribokinase